MICVCAKCQQLHEMLGNDEREDEICTSCYRESREPKWECPFCGKEKTSPNGTGSDIACCGEVGHAVQAQAEA